MFLTFAGFILCVVALYLGDMFWFLYLETPMGQKFYTTFQDHSRSIEELLSYNILSLSADAALSAFAICMAVGLGSRLLHISRHFYLSLGFIHRFFFWGIPLTGLVTFHICRSYGLSDYELTCIFAGIPTFCLFMKCFKAADRLIPELGDLIRSIDHFSRIAWAWGIKITNGECEFRFFSYDEFRKKMAEFLNRN